MTPHKMNGEVLSVELSETLGFDSYKRVEQISEGHKAQEWLVFSTHSYGKVFR